MACGEAHTLILSMKTTTNGGPGESSYCVKSAGSNERYQLGISGLKRDHISRLFAEVPALKGRAISEIKCWNFSCCIDEKRNMYVWGALVSPPDESKATKPAALCIKQPELVSNLKVHSIEVGLSMALAIEHKTKAPFVIGTNQYGELGLSKEEDNLILDKDSRKTFTLQESLKDRPVEMAALGKSGFVVAIGNAVHPQHPT